jgi:hypothetical protein
MWETLAKCHGRGLATLPVNSTTPVDFSLMKYKNGLLKETVVGIEDFPRSTIVTEAASVPLSFNSI